ncbi:MAG: TetR/AcrR family transcriptional regulator, partial [Acidobacteriota bacterium]
MTDQSNIELVSSRFPNRRANQKARTRESILSAAGQAFASRGFDGASLREIAEAAGVAQPLLVYHFGSKEGVWRAAVDRLFDRVEAATEAALDVVPPEAGEARLRAMLRSFVGVIAQDPAWLQILLREAAEPGPRLDWLVEQHSRATFENGRDFLDEARSTGLLPDLPTDHLLYVMIGALAFVVALAPEVERVNGYDPRSSDFLDRHVDTLYTLLTAGGA